MCVCVCVDFLRAFATRLAVSLRARRCASSYSFLDARGEDITLSRGLFFLFSLLPLRLFRFRDVKIAKRSGGRYIIIIIPSPVGERVLSTLLVGRARYVNK